MREILNVFHYRRNLNAFRQQRTQALESGHKPDLLEELPIDPYLDELQKRSIHDEEVEVFRETTEKGGV